MLKRFTVLTAVAAAMAAFVPARALAYTYAGRVTAFTPTSISVVDREVVTVGIDNGTTFTKLITQKPWEESTTLTPRALAVGRYVVVHVPDKGDFVANWVQVATDMRPVVFAVARVAPVVTAAGYATEAARHRAEAAARRRAPNASESKRPGGPDTALHCERLANRLEKAGK